jgi:hypothetical protein
MAGRCEEPPTKKSFKLGELQILAALFFLLLAR